MILEPKRESPRNFEGAVCVFLAAASLTLAARIFYETIYVLPSLPNLELGIVAGLLGGLAFFTLSVGLGLVFFFTSVRLIFGVKWAAAAGLAMVFVGVLWLGVVEVSNEPLWCAMASRHRCFMLRGWN